MSQSVISVIVTVYNNIEFIEQCLESIVHQSRRELEIIIVDDGSTDGSGDVCDRFACNDLRISVIHKKNEGVVAARKIGCRRSTGEYISIIDGDDWLEPDMIEKLYRNCVENDADISMCGRIEESYGVSKKVLHGFREGCYDQEALLKDIYPNMIVNKEFFEWGIFPSYWDKLFKTDLLLPHVMAVADSIPMGNDAAGVFPCMLNANKIYISSECLYHYRQHSGSIVRKKRNAMSVRNGFRLLYQSVNDYLEKYSSIYDCKKQWLEYIIFLAIPRCDDLYKGITDLDHLFPYPNVKKGNQIVIYGMGLYGRRLYDYLKKTGFCNVIMTFDQNYKRVKKEGYAVDDPANIDNYDFDQVVVSLSFASARNSVVRYLSQKIPRDKIQTMSLEEAMEESSLYAMGLKT